MESPKGKKDILQQGTSQTDIPLVLSSRYTYQNRPMAQVSRKESFSICPESPKPPELPISFAFWDSNFPWKPDCACCHGSKELVTSQKPQSDKAQEHGTSELAKNK